MEGLKATGAVPGSSSASRAAFSATVLPSTLPGRRASPAQRKTGHLSTSRLWSQTGSLVHIPEQLQHSKRHANPGGGPNLCQLPLCPILYVGQQALSLAWGFSLVMRLTAHGGVESITSLFLTTSPSARLITASRVKP